MVADVRTSALLNVLPMTSSTGLSVDPVASVAERPGLQQHSCQTLQWQDLYLEMSRSREERPRIVQRLFLALALQHSSHTRGMTRSCPS